MVPKVKKFSPKKQIHQTISQDGPLAWKTQD